MFKTLVALPLIFISANAFACTSSRARATVENFFHKGSYRCQTTSVSEKKNGIFSDDYYAVYYACEGSVFRSQTMYVYVNEANQCYLK